MQISHTSHWSQQLNMAKKKEKPTIKQTIDISPNVGQVVGILVNRGKGEEYYIEEDKPEKKN